MDHLLELCQKIHGWDKESPYEILSASKCKEDESLIRLVVRVRKTEEKKENEESV
jgi:hypothetical protein